MDASLHKLPSNPLVERYSSEQMQHIFSANYRFKTYRKLWVALAEAQQKLGLDYITDEQIQALSQAQDQIDFERVATLERELRHDVMAHVHAYAEAAPKASAILHLGATSAFVGDNTDLIQAQAALALIESKLVDLLRILGQFALEHHDRPTLGYTHMQPAQPTTVGKRATLWAQSFLLDLETLRFRKQTLRFRGVKGTTGTQASFKHLFKGDYQKAKALDEAVQKAMGFEQSFAVTGQTYDRKVDAQLVALLSDVATSAHKMTNDLRLLQFLKEIEEPFEKNQIGSSAMAYKRNPMRCERVASLSKFLLSLGSSPAMVAATQWFERTLDDSANKRLVMPQAFLAADAILDLLLNTVQALVVYPKVIERHLQDELPFMLTEAILMQAVEKGADRQEAHEIIRVHSQQAAYEIKQEGRPNRLLELLQADERLKLSPQDYDKLAHPQTLTGFASEQTLDFVHGTLAASLAPYKSKAPGQSPDLRV